MLALAPSLAHTPSEGPSYDPRPLSRHQQSRRHPSSSSNSYSSSSSSAPVIPSTSRSASASHFHQQQRPTASSQQQHQQQQHQHHPHQPPTASSSKSPLHHPSPSSPRASSYAAPKPSKPRIDIQSYNSQDLLKQLAVVLTQIATSNDKLSSADASSSSPLSPHSPHQPIVHGPIWSQLTSASRAALSTTSSTLTFHARNIPTISLEAYLLRILKYCPTTNEVFLSLLVYFDRMARLSKEATGRTFVIDSFNIHRLVIAGVTVASKFFSDVFYTNSRYAKVGGLPQAELNSLELQFLLLNNFELMVSPEEMQKYAEDLVFFSQTQQPSSAISSSSSSSSTTTTTSAPVLPSPSSADPPSPSTPAIPAAPAADQSHLKTPHVRPATAGYQRKDSFASSAHTDDSAAETDDAETSTSTDDEPTIRPARSDASSETQSLHSTETETETDEDEEERDMDEA